MGAGGSGGREGHFLDAEVASVPRAVGVTVESKFWPLVFGGNGGSSAFLPTPDQLHGLGAVSPARPTILSVNSKAYTNLLLRKPANVNSVVCKSRLPTITQDATVNSSTKHLLPLDSFPSAVFLKFQSFMYHLPPNLPHVYTTHNIIDHIQFLKLNHFLISVFATPVFFPPN